MEHLGPEGSDALSGPAKALLSGLLTIGRALFGRPDGAGPVRRHGGRLTPRRARSEVTPVQAAWDQLVHAGLSRQIGSHR